MKKIFATILAASMMLAGVNAFAQISVGAGYLNSTSTQKIGSSKSSGSSNGFYAGVSYNLPVFGSFGVAPGAYYELTLYSKDSNKSTEHYINVPVMLNYGLELASDCKLFAFAGPTLSYGIASNTTVSVGSTDIKSNNYDDSDYNRFDVMLGGGVGFDINCFQVKVGYDYGVLDRDASDGISQHRSRVHLGVAYLF